MLEWVLYTILSALKNIYSLKFILIFHFSDSMLTVNDIFYLNIAKQQQQNPISLYSTYPWYF